MSPSVYLAIPIMAVLGIVQTAVLPRFPVLGLTPQLPLLVALAWGLLRGLDEGLQWAFFAGFFTDLFSINPLGISALTFMVAVTAVLWVQEALPSSRVFLPLLLAAIATFINLTIYLIFLRLLGSITSFTIAIDLPPLVLLNAVAILPIYWLMVFIDRSVRPRRVQV